MKKGKDISAYMTVEVSLLFPIIVMVILCVIYLAFYSYNKALAFQNAGISALYGKNGLGEVEDKEEWAEKMYRVLELINKGQFMAASNIKQQVSIENSHIVISQEGNVNIPILNQKFMSKLSFSEKVKVSEQSGVFFIRQIRKVKNDELRNYS